MAEEHHDHEGKSRAAWTGAFIVLLGFFLGCIALPFNQPILFWIAVALVIAGGITGKTMTDMGYGVGGKNSKV